MLGRHGAEAGGFPVQAREWGRERTRLIGVVVIPPKGLIVRVVKRVLMIGWY